MPITFFCTGCLKRLKAMEDAAGKAIKCPGCGLLVTVPTSPEADAEPLGERPSEAWTPRRRGSQPVPSFRPEGPAPASHSLRPLSSHQTPWWLRHLHWLLVFALIPLAISVAHKSNRENLSKRIVDALAGIPEALQWQFEHQSEKGMTLDDVFQLLPEHKLPGALCERQTWAHWTVAGVAVLGFWVVLTLLAADGCADFVQLIAISIFTAALGVLLLVAVQYLASQADELRLRDGGAVMPVIVKLISFSYRGALDPTAAFLISFLGFTFGVGLCEEFCKALPLFLCFRGGSGLSWRGAFLWGLASGAGFGIAEGVLYSRDFYNGVADIDVYLVRFISCVALHAVWAGCVGITIQQQKGWLDAAESWFGYVLRVVAVLAVPMVLHGLYDTLLKKEMDGWALAVALASFAYLAVLISRLTDEEVAASKEAMLGEYQRRRELMA
jgi:RsiW-degrading membrane proteinase PrsW (M82 family)